MIETPAERFDYIVIGAGSAGCALAARLAEDGRHSVLLLEAGGRDWRPEIHIPAGIVRLIGNSRVDWGHLAEPDPSRGGKVDLWPAGMVLGGSSSINGMLHVRGAPADFDAWAAAGALGWSYEEVLPCFRRAETTAFGDPAVRGRSGPLHVERLRTQHPLAKRFIAAAEAEGLPPNADYNGREQVGIAEPQVSQRRGARWSAARAYLSRRPPNLKLRTRARATTLLFDGTRASGVAYDWDGSPRTAYAVREVIVCAGALATPKLLMLSGIGPAAELRRRGIEVRLDAPEIGANLTEHPNGNMSWDVRARTYNSDTGPFRAGLHGLNWLLRRRGPATSPYPHAVAFFHSGPEQPSPDIQLMFGPFAFAFSPEGVVPYRGNAVTVVAALNKPVARGRVSLRSPDWRDRAVIDHALLGEAEDRRRLIEACRLVRRLFAQPVLAQEIVAERLPGPAVDTDAEWDAYLRETTFLGYHPCGTCRMGDGGPLDPRLRVRGIEGLRVADASVMPLPISGNTHAATVMIGEKAADLVREDASAA